MLLLKLNDKTWNLKIQVFVVICVNQIQQHSITESMLRTIAFDHPSPPTTETNINCFQQFVEAFWYRKKLTSSSQLNACSQFTYLDLCKYKTDVACILVVKSFSKLPCTTLAFWICCNVEFLISTESQWPCNVEFFYLNWIAMTQKSFHISNIYSQWCGAIANLYKIQWSRFALIFLYRLILTISFKATSLVPGRCLLSHANKATLIIWGNMLQSTKSDYHNKTKPNKTIYI